MNIQCLCPNCYHPVTVVGRRKAGWVSCVKCGHVFKVAESVEPVVEQPVKTACPSQPQTLP